MIYTQLDNFYLSEQELSENSPSRKDGIDKDTESELRAYGCSLIQEAGILLAFQQAVMATGQVLFHRFYCKRSMKAFNVKKLAATALWQGAKLEEVPEVSGHPRELLNKVMVAIDRCIARQETPEGRKLGVLDLHSKEAEEFRRSLIRYELEMLKAFGFITHVEHPHKLLLNYCQIIGLGMPIGDNAGLDPVAPDFLQEAWSIANDSLRTTLCVRYKSSVVACGIIFYTGRKLKVPLPESPPWWTLFGVQLPQMVEVCNALYQLYRAPKARFIPVCHQLLPSKPPTPATQGSQLGSAAGDQGTTPMLGRPGGKPLDPSVRVTVGDVTGAAPLQGAAANGAAASQALPNGSPAAAAASTPPSVAPSPQQPEAPGSVRKRSRSRSPDNDRRKRQRDSAQPALQPGGSSTALQQQQQHGGAFPLPPGAADGSHKEQPQGSEGEQRASLKRGKDERQQQSRRRSRSRSRDRGARDSRSSKQRRSSRSRSRERGYDSRGGSSRGGDRYDRSDRDRGHHRDGSRSRPHSHRDRDRRDGDRERRDNRREGSRGREPSPARGEKPSSGGKGSGQLEQRERPKQPAGVSSSGGLPPPPAVASGDAAGASGNATSASAAKEPGSSPGGSKGPAALSQPSKSAAGSQDTAKPQEQQQEQQQQGGTAMAEKLSQDAAAGAAGAEKAVGADGAAAPRPKPVAVRKRPLPPPAAANAEHHRKDSAPKHEQSPSGGS